MCLNIAISKHTKKGKNGKPEPIIADKNIIVYKVLEKVRGDLIAPFRRDIYITGKLYKANFSFNINTWKSNDFEVEEGLHAFIDPNGWRAMEVKARSDRNIILYAKIPKGSEYYHGQDGDIVSNQLVVSNIQVKRKYPLNRIQKTILKIRVFLFSGIYRA